ncbi:MULTISPECIES: hypothetical protein [Nitrosospira]|uniref:hypothetical protein n=1 Tax=Nitrosospira TaxID=35798 RepID=UPI0009C09924|nr:MULTISPECIES: hypothetical protein [Nitrosospira]
MLAAIDHVRDWLFGTRENDWVSPRTAAMAFPKGVIYGYPVTCREGGYRIVPDLEISEFSKAKMQATYQELVEERDSVKHLLG